MNHNEKALARLKFQHKVLSSDAQAFEDLFTSVMQKADPNFTPVKPRGRIGDRKNDGYDREEGWYYQVFAPEEIGKSLNAAVKKLKQDFEGLKAYWEEICPVRRYYFVINDKYKGTSPVIEAELASVRKTYTLDDCAVFLAKDLEDALFRLSDDVILSVIGFIPDPSNIENLDYSILSEVISHIMQNQRQLDPVQLLSAPDFGEKIEFNGLSSQIGSLLKVGSYQAGVLENYFERNSDFTRQELRHILNELFRNTSEKKNFRHDSKTLSLSDLIFFDILSSLTPGESKSVQDAAIVLISYFFESCDIFKDPNS